MLKKQLIQGERLEKLFKVKQQIDNINKQIEDLKQLRNNIVQPHWFSYESFKSCYWTTMNKKCFNNGDKEYIKKMNKGMKVLYKV